MGGNHETIWQEVVKFEIQQRSPTLQEYAELIGAVGWAEFVNPFAVESALAGSVFAVVAVSEGRTVGTGRIVGDGAIYFYLQDVIVTPAAQGHGVGAAIMDALMGFLDSSAPESAFIGLFSAAGTARFYQRYGFEARSPDRPGMFQYKRG